MHVSHVKLHAHRSSSILNSGNGLGERGICPLGLDWIEWIQLEVRLRVELAYWIAWLNCSGSG